MLRLLQSVLFVLGATATAVAVTAGLAFVAGLAVFPSGRDAGGAVVAFMILAIGGGVLGAIAGFVGSICWITRHAAAVWSVGTWIGIGLGVIAGISIRTSGVLERNVLGTVIEWLPAMLIVLAACAFCGGVIGGSSWAWLKHHGFASKRE